MQLVCINGRAVLADRMLPKERKEIAVNLITRQKPELIQRAVKAVPKRFKATKTNAVTIGLYLLVSMPAAEIEKYLDKQD